LNAVSLEILLLLKLLNARVDVRPGSSLLTCATHRGNIGGCDPTDARSEADTDKTGPVAFATKRHFIAILQKATSLSIRKCNRLRPGVGQLQHATEFCGTWSGNSAGSDQITWLKITAVDGVMSDHLRWRPIEVFRVRSEDFERGLFRAAHLLGRQQHLEADVETAIRLVRGIVQVIERTRIAVRALQRGDAERHERIRRHHPW
jgi:hypothetical protein